MHMFYVIGRIAFVLIFILSGAQKLMDISATATLIQNKVVLPPEIAGVVSQVAGAASLTVPQLLALTAGVVEVAGGLMIAANFGIRIAAIALILFTAAATFYFHDFWNMTDPERTAQMAQAVKNLSLAGGLLVLFAVGSSRPVARSYDAAVAQRY